MSDVPSPINGGTNAAASKPDVSDAAPIKKASPLTSPPPTKMRPTKFTLFNKAVKSNSYFRFFMTKLFSHPNPEERFARYGWRATPLRTMGSEVKHGMVLFTLIYCGYLQYSDMIYRDELLANIEINRQRFYQTPFEPEYVGVPAGETTRDMHAIYDTPTVGYATVDDKSGLKTNYENKLTGPALPEMLKKVKGLPVTDSMLDEISVLRKVQDVGAKEAFGDEGRRVF